MANRNTDRRIPKHTRRQIPATFQQLADIYLLHAAEALAPGTFKGYRTALLQLVAFAGPETPAVEVIDLHVNRWMRAREAAGKSPATVQSDYRRVRYGYFAWAVERGYLARNWAALARPTEEEAPPKAAVTDEQIGRMLRFTKDTRTELRDRALILLLRDTGSRIGETMALDLADIDLRPEVMEATFIAHNTKTKRRRVIPFRNECRIAIESYLGLDRGREPGPLFRSSRSGERMTASNGSQLVREIATRAGVPVSPHMFRHAFVARLAREGIPDKLGMALTGHTSIVTYHGYGQTQVQEDSIAAYRKAFGR